MTKVFCVVENGPEGCMELHAVSSTLALARARSLYVHPNLANLLVIECPVDALPLPRGYLIAPGDKREGYVIHAAKAKEQQKR